MIHRVPHRVIGGVRAIHRALLYNTSLMATITIDGKELEFEQGQSILDVLESTNKIILQKYLGLTKRDVKLAEGIRCKLLGRRMSRGGKA